jgi:hypothetical protein
MRGGRVGASEFVVLAPLSPSTPAAWCRAVPCAPFPHPLFTSSYQSSCLLVRRACCWSRGDFFFSGLRRPCMVVDTIPATVVVSLAPLPHPPLIHARAVVLRPFSHMRQTTTHRPRAHLRTVCIQWPPPRPRWTPQQLDPAGRRMLSLLVVQQRQLQLPHLMQRGLVQPRWLQAL